MTTINEIKIYRKLNDSQKKRITEHTASVKETDNGELEFLEQDILTVDGNLKTNRLVSVVPAPTEQIVPFSKVPSLFRDLSHMNLILTNACNLNCSYCYEQHKKDFGRFTNESLKSAYDWLHNVPNDNNKTFQFFGGEPLIHKKIIMDFLKVHDAELSANYDLETRTGTCVSICSNGLLLDKEFIEYYFKKSYTYMLISLDTLDPELDHREITSEQLEKILGYIDNILEVLKEDNAKRLIIRCTLSQETTPALTKFINTLYAKGIRNIIVHPLVLDSRVGFINWKDDVWNSMREQIFLALNTHRDLFVKFSEGVGMKEDNNCMVGSDMIAIDASGDFSGCYFFTNQKASATSETILGNIYKDRVYIDRYKKFQAVYQEMFDKEEQCRTCDYQNACYQCPAGNIDTGPRLFRPDDMCQKIVKLYLDFQKDVAKKMAMRQVERLVERLEFYTIDEVLSPYIAYLADGYFDQRKSNQYYQDMVFPNYRSTLANWAKHIHADQFDVMEATDTSLEIDQFHRLISKHLGVTISNTPADDDISKCYYSQLISILVNNKDRVHELKLSKILL
jgi:radical SAM protein with 4Fe4S-binding SPASM domain